ncbi:MAG: DUF488 domain-containing protein [Methylophilaceae bacterium]|jgi:uncharacterized protein (DUF488 family)|nr:MAG: DUF488 domain-containing protein [Methylophilaceae bacterium]
MLYTFGYEGLTIESFINRLKETGVKTIIDVRELPLSRKKGFSKKSFAANLHAAGIAYAHMPALGCPKPIRNAYKLNSSWSEYTKEFNAYLATQTSAIKELSKISHSTSACLICFEADFNLCHRSLIARACQNLDGVKVSHITAKTMIAELPVRVAA